MREISLAVIFQFFCISKIREWIVKLVQIILRKVYISIDILIIMLKLLEKFRLKREENPLLRMPTLETVLMIEEVLDKYSGELNRTELWKKLPRKVMWQTYLIVLDYLLSSNKIVIDPKDGKIVWIWNPKLIKMLEKKGLIVA